MNVGLQSEHVAKLGHVAQYCTEQGIQVWLEPLGCCNVPDGQTQALFTIWNVLSGHIQAVPLELGLRLFIQVAHILAWLHSLQLATLQATQTPLPPPIVESVDPAGQTQVLFCYVKVLGQIQTAEVPC